MFRRGLAGCEAALGERHPDTLNLMRGLAMVLHEQGRAEEVEALGAALRRRANKV